MPAPKIVKSGICLECVRLLLHPTQVFCSNAIFGLALLVSCSLIAAESPPAFPSSAEQSLERTSFQTSQPWGPAGNLPADVAMVYGIGRNLPERIESWRERGYRIHLMTGVSWGSYQDYLYGRFD